MGSPGKKILLTSNGDGISQNLAFHLAKTGCRLVLETCCIPRNVFLVCKNYNFRRMFTAEEYLTVSGFYFVLVYFVVETNKRVGLI